MGLRGAIWWGEIGRAPTEPTAQKRGGDGVFSGIWRGPGARRAVRNAGLRSGARTSKLRVKAMGQAGQNRQNRQLKKKRKPIPSFWEDAFRVCWRVSAGITRAREGISFCDNLVQLRDRRLLSSLRSQAKSTEARRPGQCDEHGIFSRCSGRVTKDRNYAPSGQIRAQTPRLTSSFFADFGEGKRIRRLCVPPRAASRLAPHQLVPARNRQNRQPKKERKIDSRSLGGRFSGLWGSFCCHLRARAIRAGVTPEKGLPRLSLGKVSGHALPST